MEIFKHCEGISSKQSSVEDVKAAAVLLNGSGIMSDDDFDYIQYLGFSNFYWDDLDGDHGGFVVDFPPITLVEHLSLDEIMKRLRK